MGSKRFCCLSWSGRGQEGCGLWWAALSSQIAGEDGGLLYVRASGAVSVRLSSSAATLGTRTRFHLVLVEETTHAGKLAVLDLREVGGGIQWPLPQSIFKRIWSLQPSPLNLGLECCCSLKFSSSMVTILFLLSMPLALSLPSA